MTSGREADRRRHKGQESDCRGRADPSCQVAAPACHFSGVPAHDAPSWAGTEEGWGGLAMDLQRPPAAFEMYGLLTQSPRRGAPTAQDSGGVAWHRGPGAWGRSMLSIAFANRDFAEGSSAECGTLSGPSHKSTGSLAGLLPSRRAALPSCSDPPPSSPSPSVIAAPLLLPWRTPWNLGQPRNIPHQPWALNSRCL